MLKRVLKEALDAAGFQVVRKRKGADSIQMPVELSADERNVISRIRAEKLSMASNERLWTTLMACKYVIDQDIKGDFVECGVWRGGNALIAAALFELYGVERKVYLFDTFEGMTAPTENDKRNSNSQPVFQEFEKQQKGAHNDWCYASLEDVKSSFEKWGLSGDNIVFVKGDVCKTLEDEKNLPEAIAVLRLDTDWYESTKKELEVLYPRLTLGGTLLIDDYGHWAGATKATDEYFQERNNRPFLQYTDYTGRVAVKVR